MDQSRVVIVTLLLSTLIATAAAAQAPVMRDDALAMMAEGRWIDVEGVMEDQGYFLAKEVDIVALEDSASMVEFKLTGPISRLDRRRSSMYVLGYKVVWDNDTKIKDANKERILSKKLKNEMPVRIKGALQPDGTFIARSIGHKPYKVKSDGSVKVKHSIYGPVRIVDATTGVLRVLNTEVRLRGNCEFKEKALAVAESTP